MRLAVLALAYVLDYRQLFAEEIETMASEHMRTRIDSVDVNLPAHGHFSAWLSDVKNRLADDDAQTMINRIVGLWPTVFTRRELEQWPPFVLAVILEQF